jgi:hypothetical protein
MTFTRNSIRRPKAAALLLTVVLLRAPLPSQQQSDYTFRSESDLVLVNVTVKDKNGNFVPGLKPENFTILEDNKPQKIVSFDVENVDAMPRIDVAQANPLPEGASGQTTPASRRHDRGRFSSKIDVDCFVLRSLRHGAG